jgi:hypothetical protein
MQLRVARHIQRLDQVVRFYRDGIGLTEIGGFRGHDGYDGVFLEVPGSGAHLELTAGGGHGAPEPHAESLQVLYLGDTELVRQATARLGVDPVPPANPYWAEHGVTFEHRLLLGAVRERFAVVYLGLAAASQASTLVVAACVWSLFAGVPSAPMGRPSQLRRNSPSGRAAWVIASAPTEAAIRYQRGS